MLFFFLIAELFPSLFFLLQRRRHEKCLIKACKNSCRESQHELIMEEKKEYVCIQLIRQSVAAAARRGGNTLIKYTKKKLIVTYILPPFSQYEKKTCKTTSKIAVYKRVLHYFSRSNKRNIWIKTHLRLNLFSAWNADKKEKNSENQTKERSKYE